MTRFQRVLFGLTVLLPMLLALMGCGCGPQARLYAQSPFGIDYVQPGSPVRPVQAYQAATWGPAQYRQPTQAPAASYYCPPVQRSAPVTAADPCLP